MLILMHKMTWHHTSGIVILCQTLKGETEQGALWHCIWEVPRGWLCCLTILTVFLRPLHASTGIAGHNCSFHMLGLC
jgi:hypothetical protein